MKRGNTLPHCVHQWDIESPNGTSFLTGVCRHCNEVRSFSAYVRIVKWNLRGDKKGSAEKLALDSILKDFRKKRTQSPP